MGNKNYEYSSYKIENDILIATFNVNYIDHEVARKSVEDRKQASDYQPYPILIDARKVKKISKEGRYYLASEKGIELLKSSAILTDSSITNFLANFLLNVNLSKVQIPLKLFNDEKKALEWLKNYK